MAKYRGVRFPSGHYFATNRGDDPVTGPSWKHRRRLIYGAYGLGAGMITFGALIYSSDTAVASQLIVGGVSLISIVLSAYVGFSAFEDVKLWKEEPHE